MSQTPPETGGMPEQRGDFMLLPPLTLTFGVPSFIQQLPKEFLVTRRPVAVSTDPVGHTIDPSLAGRVPGRARRRMRFASDHLEHLIPPMDEERVDEELSVPTAPAHTSSPRSRAAARPRSSQRPPLPSRRDVHRSVSSPPPARRPASTSETPESARESAPETIPGEVMAPQMPPSTFPGVGDSSSVVRRRGGGVLSAPSSRHPGDSPTPPESASHESAPQEPGLRASSYLAPPMTSASTPIPALNATPTPGTGATPGATDADSASVHAPASSRVPDRTDAPPLQRRRSRGRINTPIVPDEDDSDLPPAVKKMLEEIDDLQAGAQVTAPQGESAPLPSNEGTSLPSSLPSKVESPLTSRTSARAQASDSIDAGEMDLLHRVEAMHDTPAPATASPAPTSSPEAASSPRTPASSIPSQDVSPPVTPSARSAPAPDIETRSHGIVADVDGGGAGVGASSPSAPSGPESRSSENAPATSLRATTVGTRVAATVPSARSGEAKSAEIRPVLAGRTGIQRRARSRPAPGGSARDTVPSGLAGFTGTPTPRVAGPRRVEVPEQVKQALRGSVGEPPTHVTVHEGDHAADMTGAVNAEAFTRDGQIYLAGDAPLTSSRGQELLAHELTHVIQQGGRNGSMPGEHTREGQDLEAKALAVEQVMASGARETIAPKALARPARDVEHPELHHRHDGGVREAPSRSSWTSPPVPQSRPQEVVISQPMGVSPDVQRRERDLRSSALSRGLGAVGSALEQGLVSSIEQEVLGPPAATKDKDSRYKRLERQAADLYPYIRARLRAELVRDRERRGRIARDWS
jgi:hypothetical protein